MIVGYQLTIGRNSHNTTDRLNVVPYFSFWVAQWASEVDTGIPEVNRFATDEQSPFKTEYELVQCGTQTERSRNAKENFPWRMARANGKGSGIPKNVGAGKWKTDSQTENVSPTALGRGNQIPS